MALKSYEDRINIKDLMPEPDGKAIIITGGEAVALLEGLARGTWERLRHSLEFDVSQGEETITDLNLLEIRRSGVRGVRVWKCPKGQEAKTGLDWEWFVGSDEVGWLRYAVQAKKLKLGTKVYDKLSHKVRKRLQAEILESYAEANEAIPLYCLYNYVGGAAPFDRYWHCDDDPEREQLGCTVTPLRVIKEALRRGGRASRRTFESIHSDDCTIPWRCLVKCRHVTRVYEGGATEPHACFGKLRLYPRIPDNVKRLFMSRGDDNAGLQYETDSEVIPKRVMLVELDVTEEYAQGEPLPVMRNF